MTHTLFPNEFSDLINEYAKSVRDNFSSIIAANPEDQLKLPVQNLLRNFASDIFTRTEAQVDELGARPDIGVTRNDLLCGFVELKAPGKGAKPKRFTGPDKKQWEKLKALPNLIYTDGSEWALYRSGELSSQVVRLSPDLTTEGPDTLTEDKLTALYTLLLDFFHWQPIVPNSPKALAALLAPLCRLLREQVLEAVAKPDSSLEMLAREWRKYLFPDADHAQFADAYAQTLTYSLLLARLNGELNLTAEGAANSLDSGHGLLAQTLRLLSQPNARAEISSAVDLLERVIGAVQPAQLRERGDPWLYFYEDFLSEYDPELRKKRGVYYTPMQVIKAKVRLVSELLEHNFSKRLSFADDGVVLLDPAAGTAAYPITAIEHALKKVEDVYGQGMVAARATECARNVYAFEFLVGPYAVAHLRLTRLIKEAGGSLPENGVQVFLTDTLESPYADPPQPNLFARKLTDEHIRAQNVKRNVRILVCMGNPPYEREQSGEEVGLHERKGGWVRHGDPDRDDNRPILRDFIDPAVEAGAGTHLKNLYNDYVYFWRWVLWKLFENPEANGSGIVALITASSYLRGPGFVGMRQKMRECFDEIWIIDLEGDNLGARKTENVFAIQTPVAIFIGVRYQETKIDTPAIAHYTKITGTREQKFYQLENISSFTDLDWKQCYDDWMAPFLPVGSGNYFTWPLLTDIFPWQHTGSQYKRTWPIGVTKEVLVARWKELLTETGPQRRNNFKESRDRKIDRQYGTLLDSANKMPTIASLTSNIPPVDPTRYAFRSFDRQWALPDKRLGDFLKPVLWRAQSSKQIFLTTLLSDALGIGPAATATVLMPDLHHFSGRGGKDTIPLYRDADANEPNITHEVLDNLSETFGREIDAEDLFCYSYAILASPFYVEKFSEELSEPGPRLPITKDPELFKNAVALGRELVYLHTFGERFIPNGRTHSIIPTGRTRCTVGIPTSPANYPEVFSYDIDSQTLKVGTGEFHPVSKEVWNFSISDFEVLQSWLKYRMKGGAGKQTSVLDKIQPVQWTASMTQELLEIIWVLEETINKYESLETLLTSILESKIYTSDELPIPTDDERRAPEEEDPESNQQELPM